MIDDFIKKCGQAPKILNNKHIHMISMIKKLLKESHVKIV